MTANNQSKASPDSKTHLESEEDSSDSDDDNSDSHGPPVFKKHPCTMKMTMPTMKPTVNQPPTIDQKHHQMAKPTWNQRKTVQIPIMTIWTHMHHLFLKNTIHMQ